MSAEISLWQLPALLDALNCGAVLVHRSGRIVHANAPACALLGRPAGALSGAMLSQFDAPTQGVMGEVMAHFDEPREAELQLPAGQGGAPVWVVGSGRKLEGPAPLSDHRLITLLDISKRKSAEEGLKEQYAIVTELSNTVLDQAVDLKHYSQKLEERVRQRTAELHEANLDAIYMLAVASEAKDQDTGDHVRRIERYARRVAREVGLSEVEAQTLGHSSILHDVGKLHVPDSVLKKPGALTADERKIIEEHAPAGERMLSTRPFFAQARRIARSHHENYDGSGYPDGLKGAAIPVEARIVRVVDVYDALTSPRVYKPAWPAQRAADMIRDGAGKEFDPELAKAFLSVWKAGSLDAA